MALDDPVCSMVGPDVMLPVIDQVNERAGLGNSDKCLSGNSVPWQPKMAEKTRTYERTVNSVFRWSKFSHPFRVKVCSWTRLA